MKKILCVLFVLLLTVSGAVLTGCTEKPANETTTVVNTSSNDDTETGPIITEPAETELTADLPDVKYTGKTIRFLLMDRAQGDIYTEDHMTSNALHDAVFIRNSTVADRYGIKFEYVIDTESGVPSRLSTAVKSGSDEYDICFTHMVNGANNAINNEVLPLDELPYVDLSKPWWDKDVNQGFSIKNHLMMINGDISPYSFNLTACMYFNKKLFDKYDLEYPYQLVREGKWTLDKLIELTKDFTADKDGDGKITADGGSDIFGLTAWFLGLPYDFYYGAGGMIVSKDNDDVPYYDLQVERDTAIYDKIYSVVITNKANYEQSNWNVPHTLFSSGRALFYDASLGDGELLREMEDEYGILPIPKYSEAQDYKSFVNGASAMICIPATVKPQNREFVSVILESLASEAYKTVTPVLKETYLKRKYTRDADSMDMLDYVIRNRVFDMGYVFLYSNVGSYVRDLLVKGAQNISSTVKSYSRIGPKYVERIVKSFDKSLEQ